MRDIHYLACVILTVVLAAFYYDSWHNPFDATVVFAVICFVTIFAIVQSISRKWYVLAVVVVALSVAALSALPLHSVARILTIQNDSRTDIVLHIHDVNDRRHKRKLLTVGETWNFTYFRGDTSESASIEMVDIIIRAIRASDGAEYSLDMQLPVDYALSKSLKILDRGAELHLLIQELNDRR